MMCGDSGDRQRIAMCEVDVMLFLSSYQEILHASIVSASSSGQGSGA